MKTFRNILTVMGLLVFAASQAHAQAIGDIISYQGKLTNADGTPLTNGTYSVTLKVYENGTAKTTQTMPVATLGGVFSSFLTVGALQFNPAKQYQLGVTYNGVETKHNIASVPVAQAAKTANTVPDGAITTAKVAIGAITSEKIAPGSVTSQHLARTVSIVERAGWQSLPTANVDSDLLTTQVTVDKPTMLTIVGTTNFQHNTTPTEFHADIVLNEVSLRHGDWYHAQVGKCENRILYECVIVPAGTHTIKLTANCSQDAGYAGGNNPSQNTRLIVTQG